MTTTYGPDYQFETATEPPASRGQTRYAGFMAHAKANPGVWVKYPERVYASAGSKMRRNGFRSRTLNGDQKQICDLWIMWPGEAVDQ